jgi:tetratricopeptide (TPR) repeat protein
MALMSLMQHFPDKPAYEDSLVYLYVSSGMPAQAVVLGRQRLEKTPDNVLLTEMVALAEESTGLLKDALDRYEQLEKKNSNALRQYKIASLQYRLKRFGECQGTVNKLMSNPAADTLVVNILYNDGGSQNVKVKAAALNVLGMAAYELGQLDDAEALFQAALQMDKDFLQPKINLNALVKEKEAKAGQGGGSKEEKTSTPKADSTPPKSGTSGKK